jgi:hypothetical protein
MASQDHERDFHVDREIVGASYGMAILATAIGGFAFWKGQTASVGFVVFGIGFIANAFRLSLIRVTLTNRALKIYSAPGSSEYVRDQVSDTRWTYGSPVEIEVKDVGWIRLPYLGPYPNALHVSLRYWIRGD